MSYLTMVFKEPISEEVRAVLRSAEWTASSWSHAIHERDAMAAERDALRAELEAARRQEPVGHQFQDRDGNWCGFINDQHYQNTKADGTWPIRAIYAAHVPAAPSVPEGWQLVPKEPTIEMHIAGGNRANYGIPEDIYRSMLAAAPKPEGA